MSIITNNKTSIAKVVVNYVTIGIILMKIENKLLCQRLNASTDLGRRDPIDGKNEFR